MFSILNHGCYYKTFLIVVIVETTRGRFHQVLHQAFRHTNLKRAKKTDSLTIFFALLWSTPIKIACKMLVKSTMCIRGWKLSWHWHFDFRLEPIFATASDAQSSEVVKSDPKIIILLILSRSSLNLWCTQYVSTKYHLVNIEAPSLFLSLVYRVIVSFAF